MRRLYLQIYASFLASLALLAVLASLAWWFDPDVARSRQTLDGIGSILAEMLPPEIPAGELDARLERLARPLAARATLRDREGGVIAAVGPILAPPPDRLPRSGWLFARGPRVAFILPDGRSLVVEPHADDTGSHYGFFGFLAMLAAAVALGAFPLVRRLTGRLERLKARVEALGEGDLSARIVPEGNDEVAALAQSFNRAAERIERLVQAERNTLAFASHELRTPLARLRLAVELLPGTAERPELKARIAADIRALDELIEELLLASRLMNASVPLRSEPVDLLALAAEEAAATGADVSGSARSVSGDRRLLQRLVRNLLENGRRYGGDAKIEVVVDAIDGLARLSVLDRGPGVPEPERERIFEPFYRRADAAAQAVDGMGLGLALVREIARRHGGEARCLAREGGGSRFVVTLPAAPS